MMDSRTLLQTMFHAAVDAARPELCLPPHLPAADALKPGARVVVVGAGKAAASMAAALEAHWPGPLDGLVVTRYGYGAPTRRIEVIEAAHPVPDAAGAAAAIRILEKLRGLTSDDLVIALVSGGGSSLLAAPADGLTLDDKQAVNRALLKSGADIFEMNTVRKHLSAVKGGRLAVAAAPARIVSLIMSDVPGDDLSVVASGPTAPDETTRAQALAVLDKYRIEAPAARRRLADPASETPKPGDAAFARVENILIATPQASLRAAADVARRAGVQPIILGDAIEGEAREVAKAMAGVALSVAKHGEPGKAPCVLLSGGETNVTVRGKGRGGRNVEFLLALALALNGTAKIHALAGDTDGVDGFVDNAGAQIAPDTLARAARAGLDPKAFLNDNDAHTFFEKLGDALITGPTLTNVNDFRAILIER
ncbi:MAG: glycerate kinase [Hyphomicrobiales bacterium]|nr:glycerate kinase [Hyphomicrobiales bacterium]